MTTYRVGPAGATVFTPGGQPLYRLAPGQVVVPGTLEVARSLAAQHAALVTSGKRRRGYADKRVAAERDYADKGA
jgi:hypothetical protein